MRLMIWSTDVITGPQEHPLRVWQGRDLYGRPCTLYVRAIATAHAGLQADLERELFASVPPTPDVDQVAAELDARRDNVAEIAELIIDQVGHARLDGQAGNVKDMERWLDETIWRTKGRSPDRTPLDLDAKLPPDDTTEVMA